MEIRCIVACCRKASYIFKGIAEFRIQEKISSRHLICCQIKGTAKFMRLLFHFFCACFGSFAMRIFKPTSHCNSCKQAQPSALSLLGAFELVFHLPTSGGRWPAILWPCIPSIVTSDMKKFCRLESKGGHCDLENAMKIQISFSTEEHMENHLVVMKTEIVVVTTMLSLYLFHCRGNRHVCILNAGALVTKKLAVLFDFWYVYIYIFIRVVIYSTYYVQKCILLLVHIFGFGSGGNKKRLRAWRGTHSKLGKKMQKAHNEIIARLHMHSQTCKINWVRWPTTWNWPEMLVASTAARTDVDSVVGREPAGIASFWKPLQQHPLALQ